jgi:hypothetical protein
MASMHSDVEELTARHGLLKGSIIHYYKKSTWKSALLDIVLFPIIIMWAVYAGVADVFKKYGK